MIFFDLKYSEQEAHDKFLELSKMYHPDTNSDKDVAGKIMKTINDEYNEFRIIKRRWKEIEQVMNQQSKLMQYINLLIDNKDNITTLINSINNPFNKKS